MTSRFSSTDGRVTSADGTRIAVEVAGSGPGLVLVGGGLDDGRENAPLAAELADRFTVVNYARRGRGGSGDTPPYAVEREIEDLEAVVAAAGGRAGVFAASSGGALALLAAAAGAPIERLAVYEVPYMTGRPALSAWAAYVARLRELLGQDRHGDAVEAFMRLAGSGDEQVAAARAWPGWPELEALAPTLAYDAACLGDGAPPAALAAVEQPVLVLTGGDDPFFAPAADALAERLPHAERRTLGGQSHVADSAALAPILGRFFSP